MSVWPSTAVDVGRGDLVYGLDLARLDRRQGVGRLPTRERLALRPGGHEVQTGLHGQELHAVPGGPLPLPLLQQRHGSLTAERVVVDRRLDLEDLHPCVLQDLAHPPVGGVQR